jgi:hypothetical protein
LGSSAYKMLVWKDAARGSPGTPRRWKNNIKMDLREILCENREWMKMAQGHGHMKASESAAFGDT